MRLWERAIEHHPTHPVTCDVCRTHGWMPNTWRMTFPGLTHLATAAEAERHYHGAGFWCCARCADALDGTEPVITDGGRIVVVLGRPFTVAPPIPGEQLGFDF